MKKDTKVVNLFGGPGCFKSTLAAGIFSLLKSHEIDVDNPYEFAKDLIWDNRSIDFDDQVYILGNQSHRIWRVYGKVDIIVCDSPILLSLVYPKKELSNSFIQTVLDKHNEFDNINIFLKRNMDVDYEENGRNEILEEALKVDKKILNVLTQYGSPFITIDSNIEAVNSITELILNDVFNKSIYYKVVKV